jgi:arginine deiminase
VEAPVRDLAILAMTTLLVVAVILVMLLARHHREMEQRLEEAHAELVALRHRLAEATRPPAQFARMHLREDAVYRFSRLRRAVPRRSSPSRIIERVRELTH